MTGDKQSETQMGPSRKRNAYESTDESNVALEVQS